MSCPHTCEKTPSTSTLGQPHCSWALEVIQTAPATMTHSETRALLTPVPRFPHHLIGDSQHFPRLPHGAVLRTQIKALCPPKEDDSEAKAACDRGAAVSTRRAVWGQFVENTGPDRDPKDRSSPCRAGVPARWVTRCHWDSKAKPLVMFRQGQAPHGPVARNGQAAPHSGRMGGQLQPCIQATAFSLLVSSPQGHRLLRARRPVS